MRIIVDIDTSNRALREAAFMSLLDSVTSIDERWLRENPNAPRIYQSGVQYRNERLGTESFVDIAHVIRQGWGDCAHLCCWRAAELRVRDGIRANPTLCLQADSGGVVIYHVRVSFPDGRIEDPSVYLTPGYPIRVPPRASRAQVGELNRRAKARNGR